MNTKYIFEIDTKDYGQPVNIIAMEKDTDVKLFYEYSYVGNCDGITFDSKKQKWCASIKPRVDKITFFNCLKNKLKIEIKCKGTFKKMYVNTAQGCTVTSVFIVTALNLIVTDFEVQQSNGVNFILRERSKQLKIGRTPKYDLEQNSGGQLIYICSCLLALATERNDFKFNFTHIEKRKEFGIDEALFLKMLDKPLMDRLIIVGALCAAEYDRLELIELKSLQRSQ